MLPDRHNPTLADRRSGRPGRRWSARAWQGRRAVILRVAMLNLMRRALSHYRELILAGTFAVMATWEVLEIVLLEPAYRTSMPRTFVIHSLQVLLIVTATGIALRAWREKTERQRALASLVEQVIAAQDDERRRVAYDVRSEEHTS